MICIPRLFNKWTRNRVEVQWGWNFSYQLSPFDEYMCLIVSFIYVTLYIRIRCPRYNSQYEFGHGWGVYWFSSALWFKWGKHTKSVDAPWQSQHVRHQVMYADGLKYPPGDSWDKTDGRLIETHPYKYMLKNGTLQERIATVCIEEREWRWKWFTWLPWPSVIHRTIDVEFSGEVGERSGSWKGGTTGCGYDMKPGETMAQTLERMELERTF